MTTFRKVPVTIEASRWFSNGDHPLDAIREIEGLDGSYFDSEGKAVRRYRRPEVDGQHECPNCHATMQGHGWIDSGLNGLTVCPGDWIVTGVNGDLYPLKDDVFQVTYTPD